MKAILPHCLEYFVVSSWEFSMPPPGNKALVDDDEGTMMVDTGIIELLISGRSNSEHEYAKSEGFPP